MAVIVPQRQAYPALMLPPEEQATAYHHACMQPLATLLFITAFMSYQFEMGRQ